MTYSLVARDPQTGALGVAVQSHFFSVGPIVPWVRPGVGAVATQANAKVEYGPRGLDLLATGIAADEVLKQLLADDPAAESRQVAVVDAAGRAAAFTGRDCIRHAGHIVGHGVSCQGNIMASASVWPAMLNAYEAAEGPLAWRMLAALDAAEAEGGDIRGRQSVAIVIAPQTGEAWETSVQLRVEDDPEPLHELRRLLGIHEAYRLASEADERAGLGYHDEAASLFLRAAKLAPDNHELLFWAGLGAAEHGDFDTALRHVRAAIALQPSWTELLGALPASVAPSAPEVLRRLQS